MITGAQERVSGAVFNQKIDWTCETIEHPDFERMEERWGKFELAIRIPPSATATVFVPAEDSQRVLEFGKRLEHVHEVQRQSFENGTLVISVSSGDR